MVIRPLLWIVAISCFAVGCGRTAVEPSLQTQDFVATPQASSVAQSDSSIASEPRSPTQAQTVPDEVSRFDTELLETLRLSGEDVAKAMESLGKRYRGEQLVYARKRLVALLCQRSPEEIGTLLRYLYNDEEQQWVLSSIADYWVRNDPDRAFEISTQLAEAARNPFLHHCVRKFAEARSYKDSAKAFAAIPVSPGREDLAGFLGGAWAKANVAEAFEWAANLSSPAEQQAAFLSLIEPAGQQGGADAIIELINKIGDPLVLERGVQAATRLLVGGGQVDTALGWLETLPLEVRRSGLIQLVDAAGLLDPERWLAYAKASSDSALGRDLISVLTMRVANRDPKQAAHMLSGLEPDQYGLAISHVVSIWHHADAAGFHRWLDSTPRGQFKDSALVQLVQRLNGADKDAGAAADFAKQISDPALRDRTLSRIRKPGTNERLILLEEPTLAE